MVQTCEPYTPHSYAMCGSCLGGLEATAWLLPPAEPALGWCGCTRSQARGGASDGKCSLLPLTPSGAAVDRLHLSLETWKKQPKGRQKQSHAIQWHRRGPASSKAGAQHTRLGWDCAACRQCAAAAAVVRQSAVCLLAPQSLGFLPTALVAGKWQFHPPPTHCLLPIPIYLLSTSDLPLLVFQKLCQPS